MPLINIKIPARLNTNILYLDKKINCGKLEIIPANVAPAPIDTKRAGKAQQISVLKLVNKLVNGSKRSFLDVVFILKVYFCQ